MATLLIVLIASQCACRVSGPKLRDEYTGKQGAEEFAPLFSEGLPPTSGSIYGVWESAFGPYADFSGARRLKVEPGRVTLAAQCMAGDIKYAGATVPALVGDKEFTLQDWEYDSHALEDLGGFENSCDASLSEGKYAYKMEGLTLTVFFETWTKVADLEAAAPANATSP